MNRKALLLVALSSWLTGCAMLTTVNQQVLEGVRRGASPIEMRCALDPQSRACKLLENKGEQTTIGKCYKQWGWKEYQGAQPPGGHP